MKAAFVGGVLVALLVAGAIGYSVANKSSASISGALEANTQISLVTAEPGTNEWKIQSAMSAAPMRIAQNATVLDWPGADGTLPELRKGTNEWTCLPDYPASPGNDPICVDQPAMEWFGAYMQKTSPALKQPGLAYMLQGGSDPSNTDPFAEAPAPGKDWMNAPPHVMVFPTGKLDTKVYGTEMNGGPWIMWAGTPYEHLMMPVE